MPTTEIERTQTLTRVCVFWLAAFAGCGNSVAVGQRCGEGLPPCPAGRACGAGMCIDAEELCGRCEAWEVCVGRARCETVSLDFAQPTEGAEYLPDASVTVRVEARAGGVLVNVTLPFEGFNTTTQLRSGEATAFGMPVGLTQRLLRAGWASGPSATRRIQGKDCSVASCQPWQRCEPTTEGGRCETQLMSVKWVSPGDNGLVRAPASASFNPVVQLEETDGGVTFPLSIPVRLDGGVWELTRMGTSVPAQYGNTTVTLAAGLVGGDGPKVFVAGWPESAVPELSATRTVTWDATAPRLAVRVQPAPARAAWWPNPTAWRKDERVQVEVGSSEALNGPPALRANGAMVDGGVTGKCGFSASCIDVRCDCFEVDLAGVPLTGASGPVELLASGEDSVANASQQNAVVSVTRVRWQVAPPASQVAASVVEPAMDGEGNLYVGYSTSNTSGLVKRLSPTGTVGWTRLVDAVSAPVVWSPTGSRGGGPGLFVATNSSIPVGVGTIFRASITSLDLTTGSSAGSACSVSDPVIYSARMLLLGGTVVTAREPGLQSALLANPADGGCVPSDTAIATGRATVVGRRGFGSRAEVYTASAGSSVLSTLTTDVTNTAWATVALTLSSTNAIAGLALGPSRGFLTTAASGTEGVLAHNLAVVPPVPAFTAGPATSWTTASLGVPTGSEYDVFFGAPGANAPGGLYKTRLAEVMPVGTFAPNQQGTARVGPFDGANAFTPAHQPILGGGGAVITVSTQGDISLFTTAGVKLWSDSAAKTTFGPVSVSPALDVSRTSTGAPQCGRPGVLYVLSNAGVVTAFIVDSAGLERNAAWPRFQHDNANSGNTDTSNAPWSCL
jgi:hypothetical protein